MPSTHALAWKRLRAALCAAAVLAAAPALAAPSAAFAAKHLGDRTLQEGDAGHDVRVLQDFLTRAGYRTPIAGTFGPLTLKNVRRFEKRHHMTVDGIAGPGVVHALRSAAARRTRAHAGGPAGGSRHLGDRTLKKGMHGHDVRVLQDFLTRAGFATPIVGRFGPETLDNVKRFERAHGLTDDGIVGPQVVGMLRHQDAGGTAGDTHGDAPSAPAGGHARLLANGQAVAPADAPAAIKGVIAAGNRIATKPYLYGGGHGSWNDSGYDCSGSVSYALHGGGLLHTQLDSSDFMSWGSSGHGSWITVYTNPGHAYMVVAGLRFDTSGASPSRWQSDMRSGGGYTVRHPAGL